MTTLSRQLNKERDFTVAGWIVAALALQMMIGALIGYKGPAFAALLLIPVVFLVYGDTAVRLVLGILLLTVANVPFTFEVPGINVQFNVAAFAVPLLGIIWFGLRICSDGVSRLLTGSGLAFASLIGAGMFSIAANIDRIELTHALAGLSLYAINALSFFMAADAMKGGEDKAIGRLKWFLGAAAAAGGVTVVWTLYNFLAGDRTLWKSNMISSGMGVGNLSLFCTVGMLVVLSWTMCSTRRYRGLIGWAAFSAFGVALLLSWSRAWFIGALVGVAVVLGVRSRKALVVYLGVVICVIAFLPTLVSLVQALYSDRVIPETYNRFDIWADGLRIAFSNPALGVGLSGYEAHAGYDSNRFYASAHNVYIQVFAETGIPGLLALLAIFVLIFREAWALYRETNILLIRALSLAVVGLIPAIMVGGMFGHDMMASFSNGELAFVRGSFYLWFLAGCVAGIYRLYGGRRNRSMMVIDQEVDL